MDDDDDSEDEDNVLKFVWNFMVYSNIKYSYHFLWLSCEVKERERGRENWLDLVRDERAMNFYKFEL